MAINNFDDYDIQKLEDKVHKVENVAQDSELKIDRLDRALTRLLLLLEVNGFDRSRIDEIKEVLNKSIY